MQYDRGTMVSAASVGPSPDLTHDVFVERHMLAVVGAATRVAPDWSVWVGSSAALRTDSRADAIARARALGTSLGLPVWMSDDGGQFHSL